MSETDRDPDEIIRLDWPSTHLQRTASFVRDLFDWECEIQEDTLVCGNPSDHIGVFRLVEEMPDVSEAPLPYVAVNSIAETLAVALSHGGTLIEDRQPLEGIGWRAVLADPDGNRFGLVEREGE